MMKKTLTVSQWNDITQDLSDYAGEDGNAPEPVWDVCDLIESTIDGQAYQVSVEIEFTDAQVSACNSVLQFTNRITL